MKPFSLYLIKMYQNMPVKSHYNCKFYPTCSKYAYEAIERYGFIIGWYLAIKRILRCNPFNKKYGYDPVPVLKTKYKNYK